MNTTQLGERSAYAETRRRTQAADGRDHGAASMPRESNDLAIRSCLWHVSLPQQL